MSAADDALDVASGVPAKEIPQWFMERPLPEHVEADGGCWLLPRNRPGTSGYVVLWKRGPSGRLGVQAHRLFYAHAFGVLSRMLSLDHLCRNRWCVNPLHLEPVTHRVNVLRGAGTAAQNARKTHCVRGHALSGTNLRLESKSGFRRCRKCKQMRESRHG